ncbi:MAG TPA: cysteine--tRNA ligase [Candidatus Saccharimonadales bacterium]|nr:cysteine--tRNA ligase [Candidatus Saccharimonadales bacterium]
MNIYNTLARKKQPLKPLKPGHISLYTCGPTVYHYYHIGNLRNAVFNDTLKRVLLFNGLRIDHIMNITDVGHLSSDADEGDDKLQSRANEEGKTVWEVAEFYTKVFKSDMQSLRVLPPVRYVKATDTIECQIEMIKTLLEKGFAYQANQAIYFDVTKSPDYGKLSGQPLSEKETGARSEVVTDAEKRHPADFALWFFTVGHFADHTMRWNSPWGEGFPGWHLECSAIIEQEFGDTIDIHTGGVDHIGTHHTNEIAQSEAAHNGAPLATYWVHNEHLMVDGRKMSKSLNNSYTLSEVVGRGYTPAALRLLYLQAHYRTQQNFTWESLDAATQFLARLRAWADAQFQTGAATLSDDDFALFYGRFNEALADDLATPQALAVVSELVDTMEQDNRLPTTEQVAQIDAALGLGLAERTDIIPEQKAVLAEREGARKAEDYAAADRARKQLRAAGLEIEDTPYGPRWRRL